MRKSIIVYCKQNVAGWDKVPVQIFLIPESEERYFCSFLQKEDGIQLCCDVKEGCLHVSLSPMLSLNKNITESEVLERASSIMQEFFGDLEFVRMPDDERRPQVKHFYHYLKETCIFSDN